MWQKANAFFRNNNNGLDGDETRTMSDIGENREKIVRRPGARSNWSQLRLYVINWVTLYMPDVAQVRPKTTNLVFLGTLCSVYVTVKAP